MLYLSIEGKTKMPKIISKTALINFNERNAIRRNMPHMTHEEINAWIVSGKDLREFLGAKRFIEKGWRMNKDGTLKLR